MRIIVFAALIAALSACASKAKVDRSVVNQPSMDIRSAPSPFGGNYLTTLESSDRQSGGGTCATCAH